MEHQSFLVDLTDRADMKAKLAQAENILDGTNEKLAELVPLQEMAQEWKANVDFLRAKLGADAPIRDAPTRRAIGAIEAYTDHVSRPNVQEYVVEVVNRQMRKIKSSLVRDILADEGHDFSAEQVSNALHHAATGPKLIQKWPERGMYAPLGLRDVAPVYEPPVEPHAWPPSPVTLDAGGTLPRR